MSLKECGKTPTTIVENDDIPLIEAIGIPVIFSDGPASAEIHGDNVHIVYYELQGPADAEVKVPVLRMIRPLRSCGRGEMLRLVERAQAGKAGCGKASH